MLLNLLQYVINTISEHFTFQEMIDSYVHNSHTQLPQTLHFQSEEFNLILIYIK